jgi:hypothetical protein
MVLIPIFMILFAGWMLWGWCVGEARNIRWLIRWCAPTFVILVAIISAGAAAGVSRALTKQAARRDISRLLDAIDSQLAAGNLQHVQRQLDKRDPGDDPDADAFDLLEHLAEMSDQIEQVQIAAEQPTQTH